MKGFGVMNPPNFSRDEVLWAGGVNSHMRFEGGETRQEVNLAQGLAWKCNHQTRNHHKEVTRVGCEITNGCVDLETP
jgi:hypothetical protein